MSSPLPNPFVGPRPFEAGETLYGREREIAELGDRLISERIILLHSPSGAGKSSLVRAGLLPELRRSFDVWGPTRINQEPANGVLNRAGANRYVMSAVQGFEEEIPERGRRSADILAGQTLAEYFTGRPRRRKAAPKVLLIFDQFEEVLTVDALAVEAKQAFFDQLGEVLRIPRVFALFVLREDYLAPLDPYSRRVPTHLRNRFRIDLLGLDAAREAMVEPARTGGREFPAVDQLVHDLATRKVQRLDGSFEDQTGRHVEPVQLQVVCRRLWDAMPDDDLSIDPEDVKAFGDVTEALGGYYADSVANVTGGDTVAERAVREWFEHRLITVGGIRGQVLREAGESGGLANEFIEALRATHLIRAEQRAGATWYELAHDRLVEPVQENNRAWRDKHLSAVQQRATLWERQERPPGLLMKDEELAEGERWAAGHVVGLTDVERRFLAASRKAQDAVEKDRRQARRIRALAVVSMIVAVLAAWQWWEANEAKEKAIAHAEIATSGRLAAAVASTADDFILSSLLAGQSWDFAHTFDAKRALFAKLQEMPQLKATFHLPVDPIGSISSPDGEIEQPFRGQCCSFPPDHLLRIAFSPDGKTLASASGGNTVRLWGVATGEPLGEPLTGHKDEAVIVAFSPDGKTLVSVSQDNSVRWWDVATHKPLGELPMDAEDRVSNVAFSSDGKILASASRDGTVRLWDVMLGEPLGEPLGKPLYEPQVRHYQRMMYAMAFSRDGKTLASGGDDGAVRFWDVATGELRRDLEAGHGDVVISITFSPDGKTLASGDMYGGVRFWEVATGQAVARDPISPPKIRDDGRLNIQTGLAFSPDGKTLVSVSKKELRLWDVMTGKPLGEPLIGHKWGLLAAFSQDGETLASVGWDWTLELWDVGAAAGQFRELPAGFTGYSLTFSPDGKTLVAGVDGLLLNAATLQPLGVPLIGASEIPLLGFALSPDGKTVASVSSGGKLLRWDVASGRMLGEPRTIRKDSGRCSAFSLVGETLALACDNSPVRLWNIATGEPLGELAISGLDDSADIALSPDGRTLASANYEWTVQLWDVASRRQLGEPLTGDSGPGGIQGDCLVAFSPDGKTLASGCSKGQPLQFWDVATRQSLGKLPTASNTNGLAFSPDGKTLASLGNGKLQFFDFDPDSWLTRTCARADRNLSLTEWQQFVGSDVPYRRTCPAFPPGEGVEASSAGEPQ